MKIFWFITLFTAVVMGTLVLAGQLGVLRGRQPNDIGIQNGRLKPPSWTPNSVSTQADLYPDHPQKDYARIAPIQFTGDGERAMLRIADILKHSERTVIVTQKSDYLYAQCTTRILRFTDDLEFWLDKSAGVIQVRSASRLGRKDFNVNRERVETIRAQFAKN